MALRTQVPGKFSERDHAVATVLDPDNPIVYLELTRAVAQAGAGMLVDPYFKADMLEWLLNATPITRLLVHGGKGEVTKLEIGLDSLASLPGGGRLEVRASASKSFHDRCLIHADHSVRLLGTSVTGVGHHLSTITPLPPAATAAFTKHVMKLWNEAAVVEAKPLRRAPARPDDPAEDAPLSPNGTGTGPAD